MKIQEKLTYTNERGESIVFSPASSYHVNFKDVSGLSDVQNAIYSTNSMGQDGDTYLGYRIESRDITGIAPQSEPDTKSAVFSDTYLRIGRLQAGYRLHNQQRAYF